MPRIQHELVRCFQDRLIAANQQNTLLRVNPASRYSRLLDCQRLAGIRDDLPHAVLEAVVEGRSQVAKLTLRLEETVQAPVPSGPGGQTVAPTEGSPRAGRRRVEHVGLYHLLEERIRRH